MDWADLTIYYISINVLIMLIFTVVVNIGGFFDLLYLFRELSKKNADELDDGRVINDNQN